MSNRRPQPKQMVRRAMTLLILPFVIVTACSSPPSDDLEPIPEPTPYPAKTPITEAEAGLVMKANPTQIRPGDSVFINYSGTKGFHGETIGLYLKDAADEDWQAAFESYPLKGESKGSIRFTAPSRHGLYQFRIIIQALGPGVAARSNTVEVSP